MAESRGPAKQFEKKVTDALADLAAEAPEQERQRSIRDVSPDPKMRTSRRSAGFTAMFADLLLALVLLGCGPATHAAVQEYGFEIVHTYPHDRSAFTEGLFYLDGTIYESTGLEGHSGVRKVRLETGEILQQTPMPDEYFGEGIVRWRDKLYQLTYKHQLGFVYDMDTLKKVGEFPSPGQGWAFTTDGKRIYMDGARDLSAGSSAPELRVLDPENLRETGTIAVTDEGRPVPNLNELEWVKGEIFANIWLTDRIARIDPGTGKVTGWIDLSGLLSPAEREGTDVLNGIAYDAEHDRLFVTGKFWPKLFEIRVVKKSPR